MRLFQWRSLKTRVALISLLIFMCSIWVLSFFAGRVLREDLQNVLGEQQLSTVSVFARQINDDLNERLQSLQAITHQITPTVLGDAAALQTLLEQRPLLLLLFNGGAWVARSDGTAIADIPRSAQRIGTNYLHVDVIATALQQGKASVSRPMQGRKLLTPVVAMAVPIRGPTGQVIGVLVGVTDLAKPNFLDTVTQSQYGKTGGYLLMDRQHHFFVTATDKSRIMQPLPASGLNVMHDRYMQGFEGYGTALSSRGVLELTASANIPAADWFLVAALPAREAFAPVDHLLQRLWLGALLVTLLAGALTWWLMHRMLRQQLAPMVNASRTLNTLALGDQPAQPLPVTSQDEIGELIGGFNRLLETLNEREQVLRESEVRWKFAIEGVGDGLWDWHLQTGEAFFSRRYKEMLGYAEEEIGSTADEWVKRIHPEDAPGVMAEIQPYLDGKPGPVTVEFRMLCKDGRWQWFMGRGLVVSRDAEGRPLRMIGTNTDITERRQAVKKLQLAASVFSHAREGITITDADGVIIDVNAAFTRITGYSRDEALGQSPSMLSSGRQDRAFYAAMWQALIDQGHWTGEIWNRRKDGLVIAELLTISAVSDAQGRTQQYVALFSDITEIKEHEHQLDRMAHFDALTSLPNRRLLADRLQQALVQAVRRGQTLALAYLDLDGFKLINDTHGHAVGDQLLIALATRMKQALREGDTIARISGDEFVAMLVDLSDTAASVPLLHRLLAAVGEPVQVGGLSVQVSASLGVTFFPQEQDIEADQLLRQADQAMYQAKVAGKNRYHVFDAAHDSHLRGHHESLERIRLALSNGEFVLYYQPKVNMRSGQVVGVEALIRWQHPQRGLLSPALFLPVIEDDPLAVDVGEWVIDTALTQIELWQAAGLRTSVSVNIGARQLQQHDFVERLRAQLSAHPQVQPDQLELEVLETSALADIAQVSNVIEACAALGVMFALDDFGTGYSSLTYLKRLRVALLKIDQSFVRDMLDDPDDLAILQGVIGLADAFKRQVIAEGVETVAHGTMLLQLGCELAQGYGIARPMPADQLPPWVSGWQPDDAWSCLPWLGGLDQMSEQ
ncbi:MAG: EAL domain-containing protein [Rhodoferax sp.]|uniref:bifunctional diguanylate cyclase/phosphodiesterase n=1 Tax=Rhodoferax sp. TaxID=50421 RepID=UPI001B52BC69|nr:EAL domain-containing protein [Rhodoferax sp.]MBP9904362.1 EAL domain-containing protein [Rhodoferax sp.]